MPQLVVVLVVAFMAVGFAPLWRVLRLAVTLVHELGHAVLGIAVGRTFTGFVLRGDMSGHAVTRGPVRGAGRVATTWAGYPMPAIVSAGTVWLAGRGWSAPAVTTALAVLLLALIRVRSVLTALVMVVSIAATFSLWWWRNDALQPQVLFGVGVVLLIGGWRHLLAVVRDPGRGSDPAVLGWLTPVPRSVWNASFVVVFAGATWLVAAEVIAIVR
ncbi:MAG: M50 family metallopeptidase [Terracoccus sp.]